MAGVFLGLVVFLTVGAAPASVPAKNIAPGIQAWTVHPTGKGPGFTPMKSAETGVTFTNQLTGDRYLTNAVAHNGAGVALGDVDGDHLPDIFLCNLQGANELYRNLGQWRFERMDPGPAACPDQSSTGAALVDVDGDSDLDLLVNGIAAGTRLFLNDGKGHWSEVLDSGLSRTASSTSLTLADIDGDGDLDLYCTHFIDAMMLSDPTTRFGLARKGAGWEVTKVNGESTASPRWKGRFEALPDGKVRELPEVHGLYRNLGGGHFKAIEFEPGTYRDASGNPIPPFRDWGLAAMFRDINRDGIPDLYVCNDNTSPDRIWINSGTGTFQAIRPLDFRHTSRSSMGVDFADINRDGFDDLIVVDMLARLHGKRMNQLVRDRPGIAEIERAESRPQFNRNTLFLGTPDGSFTEAALLAGVAATDWTWTALFVDVDLDGYEDLLVTNGFEFDVMDQDSSNRIKDGRRKLSEAQLKRSMQIHPAWKTRNAAFRNRRDGRFDPSGTQWGFDHEGVSFGMAMADLDNDGDLDLVVNNLNEAASLYRNESEAGRIAVRLLGRPPNTGGIGARIELTGGTMTQSQEMISGGRYLSCDQAMRTFAVDPDPRSPMRMTIRWRDGTRTLVGDIQFNHVYEISQSVSTNLPPEGPSAPPPAPLFRDTSSLLEHSHTQESFDDWTRQPTLPRRLSRLGPGISWYDLDADGWEDLAVTSGRGGALAVFHNEQGRGFRKISGPSVTDGSQGAVLGWPGGASGRSLLVALSNFEGPPGAQSQLEEYPAGNLAVPRRFPAGASSAGPMVLTDADGDGDLDLFVGGRNVPGRFPEAAVSTFWINQDGVLTADPVRSEPFKSAGLVSGATAVDLDGDGRSELALATEWGPVRIYRNEDGKWVETTDAFGLSRITGWWTGIAAGDFDGDGRMDLVCGNWGRNSIYELHQPTPFRLYYGEWNGDSGIQMIEAWRNGKDWFPVHDRTWLEKGFPRLGDQFPTHEAFGRATVDELVSGLQEKTRFLEATELSSMILLNRGGRFEPVPLPLTAQMSPAFAVNVGDLDGDGDEDLFLSQNFFGTAADLSRDDAGRGLFLRGDGRGGFAAVDSSRSGINVPGEQRGAALVDYNHDGRTDLAVTQNAGNTRLYTNAGAKPGLRVRLKGPPGNPDAIGAQIRVVYAGDRRGPVRAVQSGSGYWSQDGAVQVLGLREPATALWIRWPGGREQTLPLPDDSGSTQPEFKE